VEKEAEVCQNEIFRLMQLLWKRRLADRNEKWKENIRSIVDSII